MGLTPGSVGVGEGRGGVIRNRPKRGRIEKAGGCITVPDLPTRTFLHENKSFILREFSIKAFIKNVIITAVIRWWCFRNF